LFLLRLRLGERPTGAPAYLGNAPKGRREIQLDLRLRAPGAGELAKGLGVPSEAQVHDWLENFSPAFRELRQLEAIAWTYG
jgi:hypothetical protein